MLVIYRSPSLDFWPFLSSLEKFMFEKSKNLFAVLGDFNICLKKYYFDKKSESLYDTMLEKGFIHLINTTSKSVGNSLSIIGQIFMNVNTTLNNDKILCGNVDCGITDHKMQYIVLDEQIPDVSETDHVLKRSYERTTV